MTKRIASGNLMHCPKCCPKRGETYTGIAGTCSHSYEPSAWDKTTDPDNWRAIEPWGWKCDNCGHFKRPRKCRS